MRYIFLALCLLSSSAFADGITTFCKEKNTKRGEVDQGMYTFCLNQQASAVGEIKSLQAEYKDYFWFEQLSQPNCFQNWTKRETTDYEMVAHCLKGEKEGYLNLRYAVEKENVGWDKIDDCFLNYMASKNALEMSYHCVKNFSDRYRKNAESLKAQIAKSNPQWKANIEGILSGSKTDGKPNPAVPTLPDVSGISREVSKAEAAPAAPSPQSPSLWSKAASWFSPDERKPSSNGCEKTRTEANFLAECSAALEYSAMMIGPVNGEKIEAKCRCTLTNFEVVSAADPGCHYSRERIYKITNRNSVYVKCGN